MIRYALLLLAVIGESAMAHQFTPMYPVFTPSYVDGVMQTKMELFNKRKEVSYYEISVFDDNWKPITFASESRIIQVKYLETKKISVYLKAEDVSRAVHICTESKLLTDDIKSTGISSRICSKVKQ